MTEAKKQPAKALILGGGGTTGIAWEVGFILGLHDILTAVYVREQMLTLRKGVGVSLS